MVSNSLVCSFKYEFISNVIKKNYNNNRNNYRNQQIINMKEKFKTDEIIRNKNNIKNNICIQNNNKKKYNKLISLSLSLSFIIFSFDQVVNASSEEALQLLKYGYVSHIPDSVTWVIIHE